MYFVRLKNQNGQSQFNKSFDSRDDLELYYELHDYLCLEGVNTNYAPPKDSDVKEIEAQNPGYSFCDYLISKDVTIDAAPAEGFVFKKDCGQKD